MGEQCTSLPARKTLPIALCKSSGTAFGSCTAVTNSNAYKTIRNDHLAVGALKPTMPRTLACMFSRLRYSLSFLFSDGFDKSQRCLTPSFMVSMVLLHTFKTSILLSIVAEVLCEQAHTALPKTKFRILEMFLSAKSFCAGSNGSGLSSDCSVSIKEEFEEEWSVESSAEVICASTARQNAFVS